MDGHRHGPPPQFYHGGYYGGHESVFFSLLNTFFWLAIAALAIWLVYRWVRPSFQTTTRPMAMGRYVSLASSGISAIEILRRRYAAGDIDARTFEHMRERLRASYAEDGEDYDEEGAGGDGSPLYEESL